MNIHRGAARRPGVVARIAAVVVVGVTTVAVVVGPSPAAGTADRSDARLSLRWTAPVGDDPTQVLADRDGAIAVTERGVVTALDRRGGEDWTADVAAEGGDLYFTRSAVGEGLVVVPVSETHVVALDRGTGRERWQVPVAGVQAVVVGRDAAGEPLVAASSRTGVLTVIDAGDGTAWWSQPQPLWFKDGTWLPDMAFAAGRLVLERVTWGDGVRLSVFDPGDGRLVWERTAQLTTSVAAVTERALVFGETTDLDDDDIATSTVRALDLATGAELWSRELRSRGGFLPDLESTVAGGDVVLVDHLGTLRAYDARTGSKRWARALDRKQYEALPRSVGPLVAMTILGAELVAVQADDGTLADGGDRFGRPPSAITIEGSAAAGARLYLLAGGSQNEAEVWAYTASEEPARPAATLAPRPGLWPGISHARIPLPRGGDPVAACTSMGGVAGNGRRLNRGRDLWLSSR